MKYSVLVALIASSSGVKLKYDDGFEKAVSGTDLGTKTSEKVAEFIEPSAMAGTLS